MEVKLTPRQREFLRRFVELYEEARKPVHYSQVARKLDVGNVTAYEMLRILEKKGFVLREYVLRKGPGRSAVKFYPGPRAFAALQRSLAYALGREWEEAKAQLIRSLRKAREGEFDAVTEELLRRIPERTSPLPLLAELVVLLMVQLRRLQAQGRDWLYTLKGLGLPAEKGLPALGGLMAGIALAERANRALAEVFLKYAARFNSYLAELNRESRQALAEFTGEVMEVLQ